jgi:hypothetical protein
MDNKELDSMNRVIAEYHFSNDPMYIRTSGLFYIYGELFYKWDHLRYHSDISWLWPVYGKLVQERSLLDAVLLWDGISEAISNADLPALHKAIYDYIVYITNNK